MMLINEELMFISLFHIRPRLEYGMMNDALTTISDADLIRDLRSQSPSIGASIVSGQLRARGIQVTRESVRSALRNIDPLSAVLRWPSGLTVHRPYSVAGPNSL